jgi:hypothetical protein
MCLHCPYKEYRQHPALTNDKSNKSSNDSTLMNPNCDSSNINPDNGNISGIDSELVEEERLVQDHMRTCHNIDFNQILEEHKRLKNDAVTNKDDSLSQPGMVIIESAPMNDMYLSIECKPLKYIDDDVMRRDEFQTEQIYSCPLCCGDTQLYNISHLNQQQLPAGSPGVQFQNVTFDNLMLHFSAAHQFKAIPLFVCNICQVVRMSLIDAIYHFIRSHFNKSVSIGLCAFNIYDKYHSIATNSASTNNTIAVAVKHQHKSGTSSSVAATHPLVLQSIYGPGGPLYYCVTCNENYANEAAFIRHSFLAHLLDPNINLNW